MTTKHEEIRKSVSEFYAGLIREQGTCCSHGCGAPQPGAGVAEALGYAPSELASIPREASGSSFGCGNPLAFAEVQAGQTVLDLGSGGGMDCFLAAQRVGPSGKVIGLDMTQEMVERARKTAAENGYGNVEFRLGKIEEMPVESESVDWIISNCVINLSPEKEKVFAEAYRVLRPGGRLLISDVVAEGLPEDLRQDLSAWASCVAGAVTEDEYLAMIRDAGFEQVSIVDRLDYVTPSESQPFRLSSIRVRGIKKPHARKEQPKRDGSVPALDKETRLLVAAGAAVAAGCMPCLETIAAMARSEGIDENKLREAVMTGQHVREQAAGKMKAFADGLLGTHLQGRAAPAEGSACCPLSGKTGEEDSSQGRPEGTATGTGGCCSSGRG
jgi:arsenite methyltransferase